MKKNDNVFECHSFSLILGNCCSANIFLNKSSYIALALKLS
jgi:hypothetical protein